MEPEKHVNFHIRPQDGQPGATNPNIPTTEEDFASRAAEGERKKLQGALKESGLVDPKGFVGVIRRKLKDWGL